MKEIQKNIYRMWVKYIDEIFVYILRFYQIEKNKRKKIKTRFTQNSKNII